MANIIVSVFAIGLIMTAVLLLSLASLSSADRLSTAWDGMVKLEADRVRAELSLVATDLVPTSTLVDLSIRNSGQTSLRDFPDWDVVIQYYASSSNVGLNISWLPYTTTSPPSSSTWTVEGLYMDASSLKAEVYDPDVFNAGEEMVVRVNITPVIPAGTDNLITIGAPNGVTVAAPFSR